MQAIPPKRSTEDDDIASVKRPRRNFPSQPGSGPVRRTQRVSTPSLKAQEARQQASECLHGASKAPYAGRSVKSFNPSALTDTYPSPASIESHPVAQASNQNSDPRLGVKPSKCPVPPMNGKAYTEVGGPALEERRHDYRVEREVKSAIANAEFWLHHVRRFRADVVLEELERRPKNTAAAIAAANSEIEAMKDMVRDAGSLLIFDCEGTPLVGVYSNRFRHETHNHSVPLGPYPGSSGHTLDDFARAKAVDPGSVIWDGIRANSLQRSHEAAQDLHSVAQPTCHNRDVRHAAEKVIAYSIVPGEERDGLDPSPKDNLPYDNKTKGALIQVSTSRPLVFERAGTTHLVHAWPQQGHPHGTMTASQIWNKSGQVTNAIAMYNDKRGPVVRAAEIKFEAVYPGWAKLYRHVLDVVRSDMYDHAQLFAGTAINWKLQVKAHRDGMDKGPCAIYCHGRFKGGYLYLPDLNLKLARYRPGDVIVFHANALYHAVEEWTCDDSDENEEEYSPDASNADKGRVTPGRVGNVLFFPAATLNRIGELEEEHGRPLPNGWNSRTCTGTRL